MCCGNSILSLLLLLFLLAFRLSLALGPSQLLAAGLRSRGSGSSSTTTRESSHAILETGDVRRIGISLIVRLLRCRVPAIAELAWCAKLYRLIVCAYWSNTIICGRLGLSDFWCLRRHGAWGAGRRRGRGRNLGGRRWCRRRRLDRGSWARCSWRGRRRGTCESASSGATKGGLQISDCPVFSTHLALRAAESLAWTERWRSRPGWSSWTRRCRCRRRVLRSR